MSLIEPTGREGVTEYRAQPEPSASWLALAARIDEQVVRFFMVSARCGCFMQAARSLDVQPTLLRKHLAQLEEQVQRTLFQFQGNALTLNRDGQQFHAQLIARVHERKLPVIERPLIRLAVAETILHDILGRDLVSLVRRNASVRLDIISLDSDLSLQAAHADVVVWLGSVESSLPSPGFAVSEHQPLARIDYLPHIAKRYSRVTARPDTFDDLADFLLVQWQHDRQVESFRPWNALVDQRLAGVVQLHSYELMLEMVRCSACIGLLPHYMGRFDRGLIDLPGLFHLPMQRQVWMAINARTRSEPQVQMLARLIRRTFEERRDWFEGR
ncbi:LysR family transcriptional regulator [Pseudomonas sp. PB120]|uniref:LysR family transcriptional regulator n=1 Tax=Pseudomonas sp. PB120 TaxID=2494700 RepID=UPI0012FE19EE|nr:LysR family transcriptional regulator [Pseudomonas sp. PB120]MVV47961.1 LysR family transcriptional regulator [Pseudomonas sp. PB120]